MPVEQTTASFYLRVTTAFFGVVGALIGALILWKIPQLQAYSTTTGGVVGAVGCLLIIDGLFIRIPKRVHSSTYVFFTRSVEPSVSAEIEKEALLLKDFLTSQSKKDWTLRKEIEVDYGDSLPTLLKNNFGTSDVDLVLFKEKNQDEEKHSQQYLCSVAAVFIPDVELLNCPVKNMPAYEAVLNVLCMRLPRFSLNGEYEKGTLGWLLQATDPCDIEIPNEWMVLINPATLSDHIMKVYVEEMKPEAINKTFPVTQAPFLLQHIHQLLNQLTPEACQKLLPYLHPIYVFELLKENKDIDFSAADDALNSLFSSSLEKLKEIPKDVISRTPRLAHLHREQKWKEYRL